MERDSPGTVNQKVYSRRRSTRGSAGLVCRFSFRPLTRYTIQEPIMAVILSLADSFARGVYAPRQTVAMTFAHRYVIAFRFGATSDAIYCLTVCSSRALRILRVFIYCSHKRSTTPFLSLVPFARQSRSRR